MHARPALREEAPDRSVLAESRHQLHAAGADTDGRRLDARVGERAAVLDLCSEKTSVGIDRPVEVLDRHADVVDAARVHLGDATGEPTGYTTSAGTSRTPFAGEARRKNTPPSAPAAATKSA